MTVEFMSSKRPVLRITAILFFLLELFSSPIYCITKKSFEFVFFCAKPHPDAKPNLNPIKPAALNLIGSSTNGKLYSVGTDNPNMKVLHLWGEL